MAFSINTNISRNLNIKPNSVTNVNIIDYEHQKENYSQTPNNYETEYENIDTENITDISNSSSYGNTTTSKENANTLNGYQSQTLEKPNTSASSTEAMANIGMGIVGFTNGVGVAGEGVVDGAVTAATVIATPFTWIYDQVTGDNSTEEMWEASDAFVSEEYVNNFYAEQCENGIFQEMNDNASDIMKYGGEGYMLANNVGYVSGIIAFSSLGGSPTYYAALSGLGQGRETALQEGADSGEALLAGLGTATWEGVQWGVGAKLSGTGGLAVGFDTLSGAIDPVARSGIQTIYNGQSFEENFEAAGGYGAMAIGGITGLGFSALGEAVEARKTNNNSNITPESQSNQMSESYRFYQDVRGYDGSYGIDQHVTANLRPSSVEYQNCIDYLRKQGFGPLDSRQILKCMDDTGACSYASVADIIFQQFRNNPEEFEKIFGYPYMMNGHLNDAQLLTDLYVYANSAENGGRMFIDGVNGKKVQGTSQDQVYMSGLFRSQNEGLINNFLRSKDPNITFEREILGQRVDRRSMKFSPITGEEMLPNYSTTTGEKVLYNTSSLRENIDNALANNKSVSMDIYDRTVDSQTGIILGDHLTLHSLTGSKDVSTTTWNEGSGHAINVLDTDDLGVIVNTWGGIYRINWTDLSWTEFIVSASQINVN